MVDADARVSDGAILGSLLVVGVAALGESVVAIRAWNDCDVGVNASANLYTLVLLLPALAVLNSLLGYTALWAGRVSMRRLGKSPTAGGWFSFLITLLIAAYLLWVILATPAGYPSPICQNNVPPWAPGWLPS